MFNAKTCQNTNINCLTSRTNVERCEHNRFPTDTNTTASDTIV